MAEKQSYSSHDGNVYLNSLSIENFPRVIQRNPLESVTISPIEISPRVIQRNPLESVTISPGSKMIESTICFLYPGDKVQVPRDGTTFVRFSTIHDIRLTSWDHGLLNPLNIFWVSQVFSIVVEPIKPWECTIFCHPEVYVFKPQGEHEFTI